MRSAPLLATERVAVSPDKIDLFVGEKIRARRRELGLSQAALGEAIGVSFQQIQKYERGANRVSASMLFHIAEALKVPPTWFYLGLPGMLADPETPDSLKTFLASAEGQDWSRVGAMLEPEVRLNLIAALHRMLEQLADLDGL